MRLTRDHVEKLNAALNSVSQHGAFGRITIVIERDRVATIEVQTSSRYRDVLPASPDALDKVT